MSTETTAAPDYKAFEKHLNSNFNVTLGESGSSAVTEIQLVQGKELKKQVVDENTTIEGFTLVFKGEIEETLPQGNHNFSHEALGDFGLFITPIIHEDTKARYYEAVCHQMV